MRKALIIIIFSVALGHINAQERLFFADKTYESITTDIQGNLYLSVGSQLDFFSPDGNRRLNYSDQNWGNITCVDAGIASKILVFYRESGIITLLNSELSPIGNPLSLFDKSMMTISMAAMGNPNKIVLYDEANQDLLITDLNLNILTQSHITFPDEFHPVDMQVVPEHRIALLDTLHGICLFDFFGTFEREIPMPDVKAMQLTKDRLFYFRKDQLWRYDLPTSSSPMNIQPLPIPLPATTMFHIWQNTLYYSDNKGVIWRTKRSGSL